MKGKMLSQTERASNISDISSEAGVPLEWLKAQQREFQLCLTANPYVCGNLEIRGILAEILGSYEPDDDEENDAHWRIRRCTHIVDVDCPSIFGQLFVWYHRVVHET